MYGEGGLGARPGDIEQTLIDHQLRPSIPLFTRLEGEYHRSPEAASHSGKNTCRANEGCRVKIVSACVHGTIRGREWEPRRLHNRQRVHVSTQQNGGSRRSSAKHGDDRGKCCASPDIQIEALQCVQHATLCATGVQADFRILVNGSAQADQRWGQLLGSSPFRRSMSLRVRD